MHHVTISAAILAGGKARRYGGVEKGSLVVEGRSIRDRQLDALTAITTHVLVIGGDAIPDRVPACGPLGGLYTALLEGNTDATLVLGCDMPYVTAPLLGHLCALAAGADIVVPHTDRGYHPLCAVYTRACLDPIARRLASGHLKMTDLFDDVRVRAVGAEELQAFGDPHRLLANVNSPADHRELEAELRYNHER